MAFRNWYQCADCHPMQWTTETPEPVNSPCPKCGLLFFPWASEDMTTAKFKSDNGVIENGRYAPHVASERRPAASHTQLSLFGDIDAEKD